jgi:hypothetical protein
VVNDPGRQKKFQKFHVSESCVFLWRAKSFSWSFEVPYGGVRKSPLQFSITNTGKDIFDHQKRCLVPDSDSGLYPDPDEQYRKVLGENSKKKPVKLRDYEC